MYKNRKGIQFTRKDLWQVSSTLNPVIHNALTKLYATLEERKWPSCPINFYEDTGDWDKDMQNGITLYQEALRKMIYAFGDNEPDIMKYDFDFIEADGHGEETESGCFRWHMVPDNKSESDRYDTDTKLYHEKVEEGLKLFAENYSSLGW